MRAVAVGLFALVAGCGGSVAYVSPPPRVAVASGPELILGGVRAADYAIPDARPLGHVDIASFGVTTLRARAGMPAAPVLQVRFVAANTSDLLPFTVDTRDLVVDLGPAGQSRPAVADADAGAPPLLSVRRGEQRTVDLYYPLPAGMATAGRLPGFAVLWQVDTGVVDVARRTAFRREWVDDDEQAYQYAPRHLPPTAYAFDYPWYPDLSWQGPGFPVGLGATWWSDPLYASSAFHHHVAFRWASRGPGWPVTGLTARYGAQWRAGEAQPAWSPPLATAASVVAASPADVRRPSAAGAKSALRSRAVAARATAVHHGRRAGLHRLRDGTRARPGHANERGARAGRGRRR